MIFRLRNTGTRRLNGRLVETVEPGNDRSLESWTDCPVSDRGCGEDRVGLWESQQAFAKHTKEFYNSQEFKDKAKDAQSFFKAAKDFVFGRPTILENAVSET